MLEVRKSPEKKYKTNKNSWVKKANPAPSSPTWNDWKTKHYILESERRPSPRNDIVESACAYFGNSTWVHPKVFQSVSPLIAFHASIVEIAKYVRSALCVTPPVQARDTIQSRFSIYSLPSLFYIYIFKRFFLASREMKTFTGLTEHTRLSSLFGVLTFFFYLFPPPPFPFHRFFSPPVLVSGPDASYPLRQTIRSGVKKLRGPVSSGADVSDCADSVTRVKKTRPRKKTAVIIKWYKMSKLNTIIILIAIILAESHVLARVL